MPEQNPSCWSISRSNVVRMRRRWASRSLPCDSSSLSRSASSSSIVPIARCHRLGAGDVVRGREDRHRVELLHDLARQRVQHVQRLDLVAEQLDADRVLLVHRDDLDGVAADPEVAAGEVDVVAVVLHRDELADEGVAVVALPHLQGHHRAHVLLRRAEAVDARHGRDDDHVATAQERVGGRVPEALDLGVDRGVLLDEGVGLRDVRLGLVVVVVRDEVLDRVVGHQIAELVRELRGERLVVGQHEGGSLHLLDEPGRGRRLAGSGRTQQHDVGLAGIDAARQLGDRLRLVTRGNVLADDLERPHGSCRLHQSRLCAGYDMRTRVRGRRKLPESPNATQYSDISPGRQASRSAAGGWPARSRSAEAAPAVEAASEAAGVEAAAEAAAVVATASAAVVAPAAMPASIPVDPGLTMSPTQPG